MQELLMLFMFSVLLFFLVDKNYLKFYLVNLGFIMSLIMMAKMSFVFGLWSYYSYKLSGGIDQFNSIMILFMFWLMGVSILSKTDFNKLSLFLMYMLFVFVFFTFFSSNYFVFYIFYEASLIPIFLYILGWGFNYTRYYSGMYMLMYTLMFSLPMLVIMSQLFFKNYSLFMGYLNILQINLNLYEYILFMMGFMIKLPVYFFHVWLPKAHVESPCCGSMILAGILLKLGGYGLLRSMNMFTFSIVHNKYLIFFILIGSVISSFKCLSQKDLKLLVAYSSVVHMNLMLGGLMTLSMVGFKGSLIMMIGHGLCSSGLFYIVNIFYNRLKSRYIYLVKGLINSMPLMTLSMFLLCSSNMASPVSLNLISEIFLFNGLISLDNLYLLVLVIISFFSAFYSIYMYSISQHGNLVNIELNYNSGMIIDFFIIFLHWFPLNVLVFNLGMFLY